MNNRLQYTQAQRGMLSICALIPQPTGDRTQFNHNRPVTVHESNDGAITWLVVNSSLSAVIVTSPETKATVNLRAFARRTEPLTPAPIRCQVSRSIRPSSPFTFRPVVATGSIFTVRQTVTSWVRAQPSRHWPPLPRIDGMASRRFCCCNRRH